MSDLHRAYLNIGSNVRPQLNLPRAIDLLDKMGRIEAISTVWESHAIGTEGPNFLNVCIAFITSQDPQDVKRNIIRPVETTLGRIRSRDKNSPRTIDIDIVMWDGEPFKLENWKSAFTVVPMAELNPELEHPITHEKLSEASQKMRDRTWIVPRPEIFKGDVPAP